MIRMFPILMRERMRRLKDFFREKPVVAIGYVISIISMIYIAIDALRKSYNISDILNNKVVVLGIMVYLVAKIINPTQGMTVDYQLIQLKLISLKEYKILIGLKLLGGSIILSLLCLKSYTEMVAIICAFNATVNVWIFLRNRWNSRVYDLLVAIALIAGIKYQLLYFSLLCMVLAIAVFVAIRRVNYESILGLYKLIYQIGQQKYMGALIVKKRAEIYRQVPKCLWVRKKKRIRIGVKNHMTKIENLSLIRS